MGGKKSTIIYIFSALLVLLALGFARAQNNTITQKSIDAQKERVKKIEEDIKFLDSQIEKTQRQHKNTIEELVLLQNKITQRKKLLTELDNEINYQDKEIITKTNTISSLEQRLDTLEFYYKHLILNTYKTRDTRAWFMYIIASNSIEQGYRRWSYLKNYSKSINKQVEKITSTKNEIILEKEKLTTLKAENIKKQESRLREFTDLTKEEKQSSTYAQSLATKQKDFKRQLSQKQNEAEKLNKEVERMIAEAIRQEQIRQEKIRQEKIRLEKLRLEQLAKEKAEKEQLAKQKDKNKVADNSKGNTTTTTEKRKEEVAAPVKVDTAPIITKDEIVELSGSFAANKGKLPWPVAKGVVIETFGEHPHPTLKNVKLPFNNGVNISAAKNAEVTVVFDGVVKQIIAMPGYNQCILVQHGTYFTFYCKLDKVSVKVGDNVTIGTVLGNLDDNQSTSTLHFELWNGTTKQNPEYWLRQQ